MIQGELFINGLDAWVTWGIFMDDTSISALMTPAGTKDFVRNTSRLEDGTRYVTLNPRLKERDVTLALQLYAPTRTEFLSRYNQFCDQVLASGVVNIETRHQSGVVYKCLYNSCTQYKQYLNRIAKFQLKLTEPDPTDRTPETPETPE